MLKGISGIFSRGRFAISAKENLNYPRKIAQFLLKTRLKDGLPELHGTPPPPHL